MTVNQKTTELDAAGTLDGSELVPVVQAGATVKLALSALLAWITAQIASRLIPAGGATGQALAKSSAADYAVSWQSVQSPLPTTTSAGYVLTQQSATPGDIDWSAAPEGLPAYTSPDDDGKVVTLVAGTPAWATPGAPEPARRRVATMATPGGSSLVHNGLSSVGEGASGGVSSTDTAPPVSSLVRMVFQTSSTAGTSGGFRYTAPYLYRGSDASSGGFYWRCVWVPADAAPVAQRRCFVGLIEATGVFSNVNPSTKTNVFGVGADSGDADLSIIHNDASGTATKVALTGFDQDDTSAIYDALLWCDPGDSALRYKVVRYKAGGAPTTIEGSVSSEIPAANTLLTHYVWVNNGSTAAVAAVHFAFIEVERDI